VQDKNEYLMKKYAVIVAGGTGKRMGTQVPKQFLLLQGRPVLWHTLTLFLNAYEDLEIILVLPEEHMKTGLAILGSTSASGRIRIVAGGETRFHSVQNGLELIGGQGLAGSTTGAKIGDGGQLPAMDKREAGIKGSGLDRPAPEESVIFVHDGVRCLPTKALVHRCYESAVRYGSAIPVTGSRDSVRLVTDSGNEALERSRIKLVQTPQTFLSSVLLPAYAVSFEERFTDEATVAEASGHKIHLVEGEINNIKITTPADMIIAEQLLGSQGAGF
jgi:2-C-methyl-D-erythritol 4-phosphate cytidylyltransferase